MEFDPAAREGPPPRHAIESDSEESDSEVVREKVQGPLKKAFQPPKIEVRFEDEATTTAKQSSRKPLVVLLGELGEAYVQSLSTSIRWKAHAFLSADGEEQGAISLDPSAMANVALVRPGHSIVLRQAAYAYLCAALIKALQPSKIILIDEYHPALYVSVEKEDPDSAIGDAHPIRLLSSTSEAAVDIIPASAELPLFAAPNYLTGLVAAFFAEAKSADVATTAVLLPQRKSFNPHLQIGAAVHMVDKKPEQLPDETRDQLSALLSSIVPRSTLHQDTVHVPSIDAFLQERRASARKRNEADIAAMYT